MIAYKKKLRTIKMKKITIQTYDGKKWPCRLTMGAMRRYKQTTGEDVSKIKDAPDMGVLVWACVKSACSADGVEMNMGVDEFLDKLAVDQVVEMANALMEAAPADAKKKAMTMK